MGFQVKAAFGINFGLLEVLKIGQRISHTICTRGRGVIHLNYDDDNGDDGHAHDDDDDNDDDDDDVDDDDDKKKKKNLRK